MAKIIRAILSTTYYGLGLSFLPFVLEKDLRFTGYEGVA